MLFVTVVYAEENRALARQALPRRKLGFRERLSVRCRNPHDFARRAHLGAEDGIDATKLVEWKYRGFHRIKFAYCTFISPTTFNASASRFVYSRIVSRIAGEKLTGGNTQEESPECTPASSMCSIIPPMTTSVPSASASTSISVASSRN